MVDDRAMPDVSLQHQVALMLADRTVTFASSHDHARLADPAVVTLRGKVKLIARDELVHTDPPRQAKVTILLTDGTRLFHHTRAVRGTPADPMTADEVAAKALDLMLPVLGDKAKRLVQAVFRLDEISGIGEVADLLRMD